MARVDVCTYIWTDLDTGVKTEVRHLHNMCFPDDADTDSSLDEFFDKLTFLMEKSECVWFLLWRSNGGITASESRQLLGMMGCSEYHDSMYSFTLCIHPSFRGRRLSRRIMLEAALHAHTNKGFVKLSGSVDRKQTRLLKFYLNMGGVIEQTGLCSPGTETSTVRISYTFDVLSVESERKELDMWIESEFSSHGRRRPIKILCSGVFVAGIAWGLSNARNFGLR
ncbi:hypothetical protein BSKO_03693 [Bryopsis sp. KO-2023]|nr:hypothetical protein BSKO_03693 [Bryopsis sp. KO-2023]